jgi:2,4-dienoyl-CoA reductase-like NADH-dependent reductase (Old Yellow Enzyme family)
MRSDDFAQVLGAYRRAARAAREIGCDGLEIHGAHGYLLDSFLSPVNNRREDEYGGSFDNRMRFPLEVTRAVRAEVGPDFPILYRFSQWKVDDYRETKFRTPDDLGRWVRALRDAGADILHVSTRRATDPAFPDSGSRTLAGWSRKLSGLPVIAVGGVAATRRVESASDGDPSDRNAADGGTADGNVADADTVGGERVLVEDPGLAIALVESGEADLLAIGRSLIANPDWVEVVRDGSWRNLRPYHEDLLRELV